MCFPIPLLDLECFESNTTTINLVRVVTFTFIVAFEPEFEVISAYAFLHYGFIGEWFCKEIQKYTLIFRNWFLAIKQIITKCLICHCSLNCNQLVLYQGMDVSVLKHVHDKQKSHKKKVYVSEKVNCSFC